MRRTRILYGGPLTHHWSYFWLRWTATVRGLCIFTAAMSALAFNTYWQRGVDVVNVALLLIPLLAIVRIARHLKKREREPGRTTPDASMEFLFEIAWVFVILILLMSF